MAAGIFISYRRDESRHAAGRLADNLAEAFGAEAIFRDIEGIDPGVDFAQALDKALQSCVVMLVLIGPRWLLHVDDQGRRRIDQPGDWIRQEVATALARQTRVIPVLLEGAALPAEHDLPEDLRLLVRRQALELADGRWHGDLQRLVEALARVPGLEPRHPAPIPAPAPAPTPVQVQVPVPAPAPVPAAGGRLKPMLWGAAAAVASLALLGWWLDDGGGASPEDLVAAEPPAAGAAGLPLQSGPSAMPHANAAAGDAELSTELSGPWRSATGEVYHLDHEGQNVLISAELEGQVVGEGEGQFDGTQIVLAMTMPLPGGGVGQLACQLQLAPDRASMTGLCHGPGGVTPAQIYR
ncbi:MAG: toll/interleukin-1 receptor domain-containing protein [Burkholderiales bacterium]|nr:toll/interleukin-1 receptor domain-containing protein [Burkholderiales bacterium]